MCDKVGFGVYCKKPKVNVSARLPSHCSYIQAINSVAVWLGKNVTILREVYIYSHNLTVIKLLGGIGTNSIFARRCRASINEMVEYFGINARV